MGCLFAKPKAIRSTYDMEPVLKSPVIFVSGVPGAGYNTVSRSLAAITGYHVISPGELVRMEAADHTTLRGTRLAKMLTENKVSEEVIVDLVKENMLENIDAKGFILCGFPKNKKMAKMYKKEVKMPEKVISLQVADEVATMRLQQKLTELGRSETEVREAESIVRSAAPNIKKVTERFKKDSVIITVNSSQGDVEMLNEALQTATASFKDFMETSAPNTTKQYGEDFYQINLSPSTESSPQVSSTQLSSKECIENGEDSLVIEHQSDPECPSEVEARVEDDMSQVSAELPTPPADSFQSTVKAELASLELAAEAESSHGLHTSQSFNKLGKTPESTDLLSTSDESEISPSPVLGSKKYDYQENVSQQFQDYLVHDTKYHAHPKESLSKQVDYNALNTLPTSEAWNSPIESFPEMTNQVDEKRMFSSAETRDHIKMHNLSESTGTCQ